MPSLLVLHALLLFAISLLTQPATGLGPKFLKGHGDKYISSIYCPPSDGWGGDPQYIVIGTQKCGTSYFAHFIAGHKSIKPPKKKEIHFFDVHYRKGTDWYRNCFRNLTGTGYITGETTPDIFYLPWAVENLARSYPNIKVIVVLCDPVQRAWSGMQMMRRWKIDFTEQDLLDFVPRTADFIHSAYHRLLPGQILWEYPRITCPTEFQRPCPTDDCGLNFECDGFAFLMRGLYAEQLRFLYKHFHPDNVLVLQSEKVYEKHPPTVARLLDFLGVPQMKIKPPRKAIYSFRPTLVGNKTKRTQGYQMPSAETLRVLAGFYRDYNKDLRDVWPDAANCSWANA